MLLTPGADKYKFSLLQKAQINIVASPDGKVRFFEWDDGSGGSMSHFTMVAQYFDGAGRTNCWNSDYEGYAMSLDSVAVVAPGCYLMFGWIHNGGFGGGWEIENFQIHGSIASNYSPIFEIGPRSDNAIYEVFGGGSEFENFQIHGSIAGIYWLLFDNVIFLSICGGDPENVIKDGYSPVKFGYNPDKKQLCYTEYTGSETCLTYDGKYFRRTKPVKNHSK